MVYFTVKYTVGFGCGDSSDEQEWSIGLTEEELRRIARDGDDLQQEILDRAYDEIAEEEKQNLTDDDLESLGFWDDMEIPEPDDDDDEDGEDDDDYIDEFTLREEYRDEHFDDFDPFSHGYNLDVYFDEDEEDEDEEDDEDGE